MRPIELIDKEESCKKDLTENLLKTDDSFSSNSEFDFGDSHSPRQTQIFLNDASKRIPYQRRSSFAFAEPTGVG